MSASSHSGSSASIFAAAIGQCAKSRSFQRWVIAQRPAGKGRGLCDVRTKNSRMAAPVRPGIRALVALLPPGRITCRLARGRSLMPYSVRETILMSSESSLAPGARNQTEVFAVHGADPEILAFAMAKYSRSALSMRESLAEISSQRAEQFLNTFYFQYGHRSIADLAHIAFAVERLSLLAAIVLVDETRWDGQERSTRYQNFLESGWYFPDFAGDSASARLYAQTIENLFATYQRVSAAVLDLLLAASLAPKASSPKPTSAPSAPAPSTSPATCCPSPPTPRSARSSAPAPSKPRSRACSPTPPPRSACSAKNSAKPPPARPGT